MLFFLKWLNASYCIGVMGITVNKDLQKHYMNIEIGRYRGIKKCELCNCDACDDDTLFERLEQE